MQVVTPKEMAAYDKRAIENGIPAEELMERAGEKCYKIIKDLVAKRDRILVVCGSGNNGGDGQVIARLLAEDGYNVEVLFTATKEKLTEKMSPESAKNYTKLETAGANLNYVVDTDLFEEIVGEASVIVDAVFGTGLDDRGVSEYYQKLFEAINKSKAEVIAIDIPSGLNGTNGRTQSSVRADLTIIIQATKTGELLESGPDHTGKTIVVDIGIDTTGQVEGGFEKNFIEPKKLVFPFPRPKNSHKYHYGRVIIVAGSKGMIGAAALASKAALKTGAGLVTNFIPEETYSAALSVMPPEALVISYNRILTTYKLQNYKRDVVLFGPGLGKHNDYSGLLGELLKQDAPVVIDADGLWMMHNSLNQFKKSKVPVIITPHQGEFAKLLGITVDKLKSDPVHYTATFAQTYNVTTILKGYNTLVASPDGEIWFNPTGGPGLATPGSGDVLAGMVTAIMGQIKDPVEAAKAAVYYHGLAGDYYTKEFGETTLIAGDIIDSLKYVLR